MILLMAGITVLAGYLSQYRWEIFAFIVVPILYFFGVEIYRRSNVYIISDTRLVHQFSFLSHKTSTVFYEKIQDISLTQSFLERVFSLGDIHVTTSGTNQVELVFKGIRKPKNLKNLIVNKMIAQRRAMHAHSSDD